MTAGKIFADQMFSKNLVELLTSHPKIDQFEAEFALTVTQQATSGTDKAKYIKTLLEFCLARPEAKDKYAFDYG